MVAKSERERHGLIYDTLAAMLLICTIFAVLIGFFYNYAKNKAYDELHAEASYIKRDLSIRVRADRKNLINLANFAATLYEDGRSFDTMLESFEPIGLVSTIGVLTPDNVFVTKVGSMDLSGKISFEEEEKKGEYISGRMTDLTAGGKEIIRCAAPIKSNGKTIGILYGGISLEKISSKYEEYVKELDAQLFVFDRETGKFIVDTLNKTPSNLTMFIDMEYGSEHHYTDFMTKESGFSALKSTFRDDNIHVYFTSLEDINWGIILGRYDSELFGEMRIITGAMMSELLLILLIVILYFLNFIRNEKKKSAVVYTGSGIKKYLLEINQRPQNITKSLQMLAEASESRSAMFVDERGEIHDYIGARSDAEILTGAYRRQFKSELFRYAFELKSRNGSNMYVIDVNADEELLKTDRRLYTFFNEHGIETVIFSAIAYNGNNGILGVVNPKNKFSAKNLIDDIAACFSVAIYNKKHLNRTRNEAVTDALTGVLNRVAYNKDREKLQAQKLENIACVFIDVNELHIRNNNYGHGAGDEMLIFIANALGNIFSGGKIYRLGGDEFLVFIKNINREALKKCIGEFVNEIEKKDYHVAIGSSYRNDRADINAMVKEAEGRMYDSKARYYQNKARTSIYSDDDIAYIQGACGSDEIGHILQEARARYNGILRISLKRDISHIILAKAYPDRFKTDDKFSKRFVNYVDEAVHPDYHRAVISFANYSVLKKQLSEGKTPKISYKKLNGETISLSVYGLDKGGAINDTLWIFARE